MRKGADERCHHPKKFAQGLNFYKLFWVFFIGCFLGVVVETIWCLLTRLHFESRSGLIYGPFNLVYGFGALFMTLGLYWLRNRSKGWIFLGGVVIGSIFEYLCSWIQEKMFGTVSWEYSNIPLNLNGRINLLYSVFWGLLALLWIKVIYPVMSRWTEKIPYKAGVPLTYLLLVFMIFNTIISGLAVGRMSERHHGIPAESSADFFLDEHYPDAMLEKIYPNMVYVNENPLGK